MHFPARRGSFIRRWEYAQRAVRLQDDASGLAQADNAAAPHPLHQIGEVKAEPCQLLFADFAVAHQHARPAADDPAHPHARIRERAEQAMHQKQRQNRDHAAQQRYFHIRHRQRRQIRNHQRDDHFIRLQLRQLPFAHQPQHHGRHKKEHNRSQKACQHIPLPFSGRINRQAFFDTSKATRFTPSRPQALNSTRFSVLFYFPRNPLSTD